MIKSTIRTIITERNTRDPVFD